MKRQIVVPRMSKKRFKFKIKNVKIQPKNTVIGVSAIANTTGVFSRKPILRPTWKNVLYTGHKIWGFHIDAQKAAQLIGYSYFVWNGHIYYTTTGKKTGLTTEDVI